MEYEHIVHSFEPIFDSASQILILGTLPSVKSRETNFYYGHKQNRFWKVLAALFQEPIPETIDEKKHLLLRDRKSGIEGESVDLGGRWIIENETESSEARRVGKESKSR
mgnify:CR=1 FL=1